MDLYDAGRTAAWASEHLYVPIAVSTVYLAVVFWCQRWMKKHKPFDVRMALIVWNCCLAIFSIAGFFVLTPSLIRVLFRGGYVRAVCGNRTTLPPWLAFWSMLFVLSKFVELGDTFFIILRKSPLSFLHWYHHVTVLMYSWYGYATKNSAGHCFSSLNFGVHSIMYSYYVFKVMQFRIPPIIAKMITVLQLTQFIIGLVMVFTGMYMWLEKRECGMNETHVKAGLIIYGSYFILFLNFAYHRYIKQKNTVKTD